MDATDLQQLVDLQAAQYQGMSAPDDYEQGLQQSLLYRSVIASHTALAQGPTAVVRQVPNCLYVICILQYPVHVKFCGQAAYMWLQDSVESRPVLCAECC